MIDLVFVIYLTLLFCLEIFLYKSQLYLLFPLTYVVDTLKKNHLGILCFYD